MPAILAALGELPAKLFFDIATAPAKKDLEQATDLIFSVTGGDIAVRVRRNKHYQKAIEKFGFDWSVRAFCRGHKTEIDKLREGFAKWYFYGYSKNDSGDLAVWWLLDMDKVRSENVLAQKWPQYPNGDGTEGRYIPISFLEQHNCIIAKSQ